MFKQHKFVISTLALACVNISYAATAVDLNKKTNLLFNSSLSSVKELSRDKDQNQTTHIRIQQTYKNYPIWGADAVVHIPAGNPVTLTKLKNASFNGIFYQNLETDLNNTPTYIFQVTQKENALKHALNLYKKTTVVNQYDLSRVKNEMIVYVDNNHKAHWCFLISVLANIEHGHFAVPTFIMDAMTFNIYEEWNDAQTLEDVSGGGFGGNVKMGKLTYDGLTGNYPTLSLQRDASKQLCYLQNKDVEVMDAGKPHDIFSDAPISQFTCSTPNKEHNNIYWDADEDAINEGFSPANDALYIGQVIKEMYQRWYNLPVLSVGGYPMKLKMNVHAKTWTGEGMDNAMFLSLNNEMYFGDGVEMFYPLTSLGVGAHEISHGFTSQHSNLTYQKQSGGLNESFSDMAAQAAEFYSVGKNSWAIGPEIVKGKGALRYMDDPTKDGKSIADVKNYNDDLNVHYSSGIFNKVFYLLGTTQGWDTKKAFDVMVNANLHYWTANSTFLQAACGAEKAAKDLHYDVSAVTSAVNAVGIDTTRC